MIADRIADRCADNRAVEMCQNREVFHGQRGLAYCFELLCEKMSFVGSHSVVYNIVDKCVDSKSDSVTEPEFEAHGESHIK